MDRTLLHHPKTKQKQQQNNINNNNNNNNKKVKWWQQELSVYSHEFCRVISLPFNFFVFLSAQFLFHLCFLECPSSLHIILLQTNSTKLLHCKIIIVPPSTRPWGTCQIWEVTLLVAVPSAPAHLSSAAESPSSSETPVRPGRWGVGKKSWHIWKVIAGRFYGENKTKNMLLDLSSSPHLLLRH